MRPWYYINILSLDVAVGAMIGCAFFARVFQISILPHALWSLGLIVWIIYTIDHLADAANCKGQPATERHRFHKRNATLLLILVIMAAGIVTIEAFLVRRPVLFAGLTLALLVIIYLWLQSSLKFVKEIAGALLYTAGVLAAPWSLLSRPLSGIEIGLVSFFGVTAFINLLLFSWFDRLSDQQDNHFSFATTFGERATRTMISMAFLSVAIFTVALLVVHRAYSAQVMVLLLMNGLLFLTFHFSKYFGRDDRYRRVGDSIFLIPLVYILFF